MFRAFINSCNSMMTTKQCNKLYMFLVGIQYKTHMQSVSRLKLSALWISFNFHSIPWNYYEKHKALSLSLISTLFETRSILCLLKLYVYMPCLLYVHAVAASHTTRRNASPHHTTISKSRCGGDTPLLRDRFSSVAQETSTRTNTDCSPCALAVDFRYSRSLLLFLCVFWFSTRYIFRVQFLYCYCLYMDVCMERMCNFNRRLCWVFSCCFFVLKS